MASTSPDARRRWPAESWRRRKVVPPYERTVAVHARAVAQKAALRSVSRSVWTVGELASYLVVSTDALTDAVCVVTTCGRTSTGHSTASARRTAHDHGLDPHRRDTIFTGGAALLSLPPGTHVLHLRVEVLQQCLQHLEQQLLLALRHALAAQDTLDGISVNVHTGQRQRRRHASVCNERNSAKAE